MSEGPPPFPVSKYATTLKELGLRLETPHEKERDASLRALLPVNDNRKIEIESKETEDTLAPWYCLLLGVVIVKDEVGNKWELQNGYDVKKTETALRELGFQDLWPESPKE